MHTKSNYARYGESVCFRIDDGGIVWDGFSDIDRQTMEQAARQRKTPGEVIQDKEAKDGMNDALVKALMDAGNPFETVRFTYDGFKARYGKNIFGSMQPKKALDAVSDAMYSRGYEIRAGIQVRAGEGIGKGFSISGVIEGC